MVCLFFAAFALGERQARAQGNDSLWNGTIIGAAAGAGGGVLFTYAVRDSELGVSQDQVRGTDFRWRRRGGRPRCRRLVESCIAAPGTNAETRVHRTRRVARRRGR